MSILCRFFGHKWGHHACGNSGWGHNHCQRWFCKTQDFKIHGAGWTTVTR